MASVRTQKKDTIELNPIQLSFLAQTYQRHTNESIQMPISVADLLKILAQFGLFDVDMTPLQFNAFSVNTNDSLQALQDTLAAMPAPVASAPPEDSDDEVPAPQLTEALLAQHLAAGGGATLRSTQEIRFFGSDGGRSSRSSSVYEETPIEPLQNLLISHLNAIFDSDGKSLSFIGKLLAPLGKTQPSADKITEFMGIVRKSWGISLGRSHHYNVAIKIINQFTAETLLKPAVLQQLITELKSHKDLTNYQPPPLPMNPALANTGGGYRV
jgi:hypothetical protein